MQKKKILFGGPLKSPVKRRLVGAADVPGSPRSTAHEHTGILLSGDKSRHRNMGYRIPGNKSTLSQQEPSPTLTYQQHLCPEVRAPDMTPAHGESIRISEARLQLWLALNHHRLPFY